MTKQEQVENLYNQFMDYTKTAEQHQFPYLFQCEMMINAGYEDLQRNWNDSHADTFIRSVAKLLVKLGNEVLSSNR